MPTREPRCRPGCGACCVAISISSPMPGLPSGKPAGMACPSLTEDLRCAVFGTRARPAVCSSLKPMADMCGGSRAQAMANLERLERMTRPS